MKLTKRLLLSDTAALVLFSGLAGIITTFLYETVLIGLTVSQWTGIRILYNGLRFVGGRLCGKITDRTRHALLGNSTSRFRKAIADALALSIYQIPIYVFSALVVGAELRQIGMAIPIYLCDNLLFGWLYGVILDWMRSRVASTS